MKQLSSEVLSSREVSRDCRELSFSWEGEPPLPGQFLTVRCSDTRDVLLRRPFAFASHDARTRSASIVYLVRGQGTAWLSRLEKGDGLDLLGPLGTPFDVPEGAKTIAAGGGIGVGPILFLSKWLTDRKRDCLPVFGFRAKDMVPDLPWPENAAIATDDGSYGLKGNVAACLETLQPDGGAILCACGPEPMLASLALYARKAGLAYQASVEQWMACGVGACAGCAVRMADGSYRKACVDGPVFDGATLAWGEA